MFASRLDVYGRKVLVECFDSRIKNDLDHDFAYFVTGVFDRAETEFFHLTVLPKKRRPRFWIPLLKTKRSVLYASPLEKRRVCFFNSAWLEYSYKDNECTIYTDDPVAGYEAVYFVLLSYLGEHLGREGVHRIHGMGFTFKGRGILVLAPSGGGKSTLAMELLRREDVEFLSDDTPMLNAQGEMLAFPQRIALKDKPNLESKYVRRFKRFEHGEKYVIGADYFGSKVKRVSDIQWLVKLDTEGGGLDIKEVSRLKFIWPLLKWLVLGLETPQIWELVLRPTKTEIRNQGKMLWSRIQTAFQLVSNSRVAVMKRGATPHETIGRLSDFLSKEEGFADSGESGPTKN